MAIEIKWVEARNTTDSIIDIPYGEVFFTIYFSGNAINKTEWKQGSVVSDGKLSKQAAAIKQLLKYPRESLAVCLEKQGSPFRNKVWVEISKIPVGQTLSYSQLAQQIGSGARAVANACRDNPFPGIIPCHRVVAISGIGGYMGQTSGYCLDIKRKLLAVEAGLSIK